MPDVVALPPGGFVAAGSVDGFELELSLPPQAARPAPSARAQIAVRIKRCRRVTGAPLPWWLCLDPSCQYYGAPGIGDCPR